MNGAEIQWQFVRSMWVGGALMAATFCGLILAVAGNGLIMFFLLAPLVWLLLLPYHARLAVVYSTIFFNSALILPFMAGRPFLWEAVGVLGWSGIAVTLALREQSPDSGWRIRRNLPLFIGTALFCAVLFVTMYFRGVGIKALGGTQVGGRIYIQQLTTAIFPLLFALAAPKEKQLVRLFLIQCALTSTFVLSDLAFAYGQGAFYQILNFVELPNDGINFDEQASAGGIRRFQSMLLVATGWLSYLWVKQPFSSYLSKHAIWVWPLTIGLLLAGLSSGHRMLIYATLVTVFTLAWSQRFFTPFTTLMSMISGALIYVLVAAFAKDLPLSTQRALSFIPGIQVDPIAAYDAWTTMEGRRLIRDAGWAESKKYRWLGRGFSKQKLNSELYADQTFLWVDFGVFYNGTVGTLVNLGIPGAVAVALFLYGGTRSAIRIVRCVHSNRFNDEFSRMSCIISGAWFANAFSFVFMHGDSEFTMRLFALPSAMLLTCDYWLTRRTRGLSNSEDLQVTPVRQVYNFGGQPA